MTDAGDPTITVSLPALLPWMNLIFSIAAGFAWGIVVWMEVRHPGFLSGKRLRLLLVGMMLAILVLIFGAANQAGLFPVETWIVVGSGGRLAIVVLGIVVASGRKAGR